MLALLAITFSFLAFTADKATAAVPPYFNIFTTGSNGSLTPKSIFTFDEKPWLFIQLQPGTIGDAVDSATTTQWTSPTLDLFTPADNVPFLVKSTNGFWLSFTDAEWSGIKKSGNWSIDSTSIFGLPTDEELTSSAGQTVNFHVTAAPEPTSIALFLLGGMILAYTFYRRKFAVA